MTGIVQKAENWIEHAVQEVEAIAEADGKIIWNAFSLIWQTLSPQEWAIFQPIAAEAITDLFDGDLADLETQVLMKAEAAGVDFLKKLDSATLQIVLGLFVQAPKASPAA